MTGRHNFYNDENIIQIPLLIQAFLNDGVRLFENALCFNLFLIEDLAFLKSYI